MAQRTAMPGEINGNAIDRYTIGHAAFGTILGLGRVPWWGALGVAVGWEFLEHVLKDIAPGAFPHATQDTLLNSTFDVLAIMLGWGVIEALPPPHDLGVPLVRRRRRIHG